MSEPRELARRIVIAGDGPLGVLAAIALKQALPSTDVLVLAIPPDPGAFAERIGTALPFANRLHDRLGIAEEDLVREAGASHRLIVRYLGGGGPEHSGAAGYGAALDPAMTTAFAKEWGGGPRNAGTAAPPGSLGEVLAAAGRFAPPSGEADHPLAELDYALRWNVAGYRDLLVATAQRLGVRHLKAAVRGLKPDQSGGIAALAVEGAEEIAADLFVDCSGPRALLLSLLGEARQIDWQDVLPVLRIAFAAPAEPMVTLEDRATLTPLGWRWELAGRDGRQALLGLCDEADADLVARHLRAAPAEVVSYLPGRAAAPWLGNVIALGDAAVRLEPLGGIAQDLAQRQLALLLELLPGRTIDPKERAEYNRRVSLMADRAADWLAAHYAAPAAATLFPGLSRSAELERALDQFSRRGRTPFVEEAPMLVQEWGALLRALGLPAGEGALAAAESGSSENAARSLAVRAEAALRRSPPYADWLGRVLGIAPSRYG